MRDFLGRALATCSVPRCGQQHTVSQRRHDGNHFHGALVRGTTPFGYLKCAAGLRRPRYFVVYAKRYVVCGSLYTISTPTFVSAPSITNVLASYR